MWGGDRVNPFTTTDEYIVASCKVYRTKDEYIVASCKVYRTKDENIVAFVQWARGRTDENIVGFSNLA